MVLRMLRRTTFLILTPLLLLCSLAEVALSQSLLVQTRDSLFRAEEVLSALWDDGVFDENNLSPMIVVGVFPYSEDTRRELSARGYSVLRRSFRDVTLRICQACMSARVFQKQGRLDYSIGLPPPEDVKRLDEQMRGVSPPARSMVTLTESARGVALEIVSLVNGRVLYAEHFTPELERERRSRQSFSRAAELQRRSRGESLTHSFVDYGLLGYNVAGGLVGVHLALDWMEQWGPNNEFLTGLSISVVGPVLGVGASAGMAFPQLFDALMGAKVHLSVPNLLVSTIAQSDQEIIDPTVTVTGYLRVPYGLDNYGAFLFGSSSGSLGIGISSLNTSILPVVP